MTLVQTKLQSMEMKERESFKEYGQCWREFAALVEPHLSAKEMTDILVYMLRYPYFDRLVSSGASGFVDLAKIGDRIEKGLKYGKNINNAEASSAPKKFYGNSRRRRREKPMLSSPIRGDISKEGHNILWCINNRSFPCHIMHNPM